MTRKLASIFLVTLLLTIGAMAQQAATPAASGPAGTKVGIINIQAAIVQTNEGQRDFQALQKKFEPKQNELQGASTEIENMKKQLSTQGDKLNDDARANLAKQIDQKQKTLQRSFEDAQSDFQAEQNTIAQRIGQKLMNVLDEYAKQNGFAVVLDVSSPQSPVLWAGRATDITEEIVNAYNAQSGVPAPAAPAGAKPGATATRPAGQGAQKPATPTAPAKKP